MPKHSEVYVALKKLLEDGEWHEVSAIVDKLSGLIQVGDALRFVETQRLRGGSSGPRRSGLDAMGLVFLGRRTMVLNSMRDARRRGVIEWQEEDVVERVRLTPRDWITLTDLSLLLQIGSHTSARWIRSPAVLAQVGSYCPAGVPPVIRVNSRRFRIPNAAVPAWERFKEESGNVAIPNRRQPVVARILATLLSIPLSEAQELVEPLAAALAAEGMILRHFMDRTSPAKGVTEEE